MAANIERIFFASGNMNKLREIRSILPDIELISARDMRQTADTSEPAEDAFTFVENALIKARWGTRLSGMPALADDSGLIVPLLEGAPGVHSARYAGDAKDDLANCRKLLQQMEKEEKRNDRPVQRRAYFYCTMVLLRHAEDPAPFICGARWHGTLGKEPKGEQGFGYDPIFHSDEHPAKSVAELPAATKNKISHRARALTKLQAFLAKERAIRI